MYDEIREIDPALALASSGRFFRLLLRDVPLFLAQNREIMLRVFYDAAKAVYYKQKNSQKPRLKEKEIAKCLELVFSHHQRDRQTAVEGQLAENFGRPFSENEALDYYEKRVEGTIVDTLGRAITIDTLGIDFLYERHQKHGIYLEYRGKRLSWIRHALSTSREIFTGIEEGREQLYYVSHYVIPLRYAEAAHAYFVVIVRKRKDKTLGFLTAFPIGTYNKFLRKAVEWRPTF